MPSLHGRHTRLRQRHRTLQALRSALDERGFTEITAPCLVEGTCPDAHIASFAVGPRYLTTSTEYAIKRLIAEGMDRLYTLQANFREGDQGPLHNPEFTMLEWARVDVGLAEIEADAQAMVCAAAAALGVEAVERAGRRVPLQGSWERLPLRVAVERHLGVPLPSFEAEALAEALRAVGEPLPPGADRDLLFALLQDRLQAHLGWEGPIFLVDWPDFQTSSGASADGVAERSELFIAGVELADGFPSLLDPAAQRAAFARAAADRRRQGLPSVTLDHRYLEALDGGLPAGAGMALGVERLLLLLLGAPHIRDVMAISWAEL
jgi:lysyl-tRNA synthetase class 2